MREITDAEREFARGLAEACIRDRLRTFGCANGTKGRARLARIAPPTDNEKAWEAYLYAVESRRAWSEYAGPA